MRKQYIEPKADFIDVECEDILTVSEIQEWTKAYDEEGYVSDTVEWSSIDSAD